MDFGAKMEPEREPHMIREALGHHASRYKAALGKGDEKLANEHAGHFFRILNMVHKAEPHSHGKLQVQAVPVQPWERNHPSRSETYAQRMARDPVYAAKDNPYKRGKKKAHQYVEDTKGFAFEPAKNDWSVLRAAPHASYSREVSKHGHNGPYPMEQTKINGKYITIDDSVDPHDGNKLHPFDSHPILTHYNHPVTKRTAKDEATYHAQRDAYLGSDHMDRHYAQQDSVSGDENRGLMPSAPVHGEGGPRLDVSRPSRPGRSEPLQESDAPMDIDRTHLDASQSESDAGDVNWDLLPESLRDLAPRPESKPAESKPVDKPSSSDGESEAQSEDIPDKYKHLFEGK